MASLFVKDLTSLDLSDGSVIDGLVGDTLMADVVLKGELNPQNFVMDFGLVKKQIKALLDGALDHKLVIPEKTPGLAREYVKDLGEKPESIRLELPCRGGTLEYHAPREAVSFIAGDRVDVPALEAHCQEILKEQLPSNIQEVTVRLREEHRAGYFFHYSHGLKKHEGHCQRLAHGHRSTLAIWENGERNGELEKEWAARWDKKFLGTGEDLAEQEDGHHLYRTRSSQGDFLLRLPKDCCEPVPMDTTIECLADYIAGSLKEQHPESEFRVEAYEGIGKGAIAVR